MQRIGAHGMNRTAILHHVCGATRKTNMHVHTSKRSITQMTAASSHMVSFYAFTDVEEPEKLATCFHEECSRLGLLGRVLVASEGVNGALAGRKPRVHAALEWLRAEVKLPHVVMSSARVIENGSPHAPFHRLKVLHKQETIALRGPAGLDMSKRGEHVAPEDWDALIQDKKKKLGKKLLVLDVRNEYETRCGSFMDAETALLKTQRFGDFPDAVDSIRDGLGGEDAAAETEVAMFCTGGVRCEKASAVMLAKGFSHVYQLEGGVLGYLSAVPGAKSSWQGDCFVFDNRVAVSHPSDSGNVGVGPAQRIVAVCHGCRTPLTEEDVLDDVYSDGVCCRHCIDELSDKQRRRRESRQRNISQFGQRLGVINGNIVEYEEHSGSDDVGSSTQEAEEESEQKVHFGGLV